MRGINKTMIMKTFEEAINDLGNFTYYMKSIQTLTDNAYMDQTSLDHAIIDVKRQYNSIYENIDKRKFSKKIAQYLDDVKVDLMGYPDRLKYYNLLIDGVKDPVLKGMSDLKYKSITLKQQLLMLHFLEDIRWLRINSNSESQKAKVLGEILGFSPKNIENNNKDIAAKSKTEISSKDLNVVKEKLKVLQFDKAVESVDQYLEYINKRK